MGRWFRRHRSHGLSENCRRTTQESQRKRREQETFAHVIVGDCHGTKSFPFALHGATTPFCEAVLSAAVTKVTGTSLAPLVVRMENSWFGQRAAIWEANSVWKLLTQ